MDIGGGLGGKVLLSVEFSDELVGKALMKDAFQSVDVRVAMSLLKRCFQDALAYQEWEFSGTCQHASLWLNQTAIVTEFRDCP